MGEHRFSVLVPDYAVESAVNRTTAARSVHQNKMCDVSDRQGSFLLLHTLTHPLKETLHPIKSY